MAKNNKNNKNLQKKEEKPKAKTPKAPAAAPTTKTEDAPAPEKKDENVEDAQVVAQAMNPEKILQNRRSTRGGLSPDATVQALDLAHRVFVEETRPEFQFPIEVGQKVNKIVAIGILCTLADHAVGGEGTFATVLNSQGYPALAAAAKDLGFEIPDIKALPAGNAEGTVMLQADKVEVPADTKKQLKKEREIRQGEKPELDPEKITSAEDVTKALQYMFTTTGGKRLPVLITEAIDFMKKFRLHEASLAENADEAKAKFEAYNSGDWLDDVFSYFRPPVFFTGIGRGMASVCGTEGNPIHAFIILRDAIKGNDGNPVLEDQEIAYAARSIMKWYCDTMIESNNKAIENLDPKKNKSEIEKCEAQIQYYNNILTCITSPSSAEIDSLLDNIGSKFDAGGTLTTECQKANATFNHICKSYYGKQLSDADYKNLNANIQQYGYHIINLFRPAGDKLMDCGLSNISELEERTPEEREAFVKESKKKLADEKAAAKKEESKNA